MTLTEMKKAIVKAFQKMYGFAPTTLKAIVPMESAGWDDKLDWLAFCVGGIGYTYDGKTDTLEKDDAYDLQ